MKHLLQTLNIWRTSDMMDHLISYVVDHFPEVCKTNRSYYPLPGVLKGCLNRLKISARADAIDEVNLLKKVC